MTLIISDQHAPPQGGSLDANEAQGYRTLVLECLNVIYGDGLRLQAGEVQPAGGGATRPQSIGRALVSELIAAREVTIKKGDRSSENKYEDDTGQGRYTIRFGYGESEWRDPDVRGEAPFQLAHELFHAWEDVNQKLPGSRNVREPRALRAANQIRSEHGQPLRDTYNPLGRIAEFDQPVITLRSGKLEYLPGNS